MKRILLILLLLAPVFTFAQTMRWERMKPLAAQVELSNPDPLDKILVEDATDTTFHSLKLIDLPLSQAAIDSFINQRGDISALQATKQDVLTGTETVFDGWDKNVADDFSGDYNDLDNKPTIPTVNNSIITLQRNSSSIGSFTLNQPSNETFNFIDQNTQLSQAQVNDYELDPNWKSEKSSYLRSDISDTYGSGISQLLTINGRLKINNYNGGLRFGFNDGTQTTMYIHGQNGPGDDALAITRVAEDNYIWDFRGTLRQGGLNVWHTGNFTDNSTSWNTAYTHSQLITGNPHNVLATEISDFDTVVSNNPSVVANTGKDTTGIYHSNRSALDLVSGTNTGDETLLSIKSLVSNDFHNLGGVDIDNQTLSIDSTDRVFTISISNENSVTFEDTNTQLSAGEIAAFGYIKNADETDQVYSADSANIVWFSDLADTAFQIRADIPTNNNQLINGAGYITDYTVTEQDVTQHQSALVITESQVSDLAHFTNADETDQVWISDSVNYATKNYVNGQGFLTSYTEKDPIFAADSANIVHFNELNYFTGADITGTEPAFVGWDKNVADDFSGDYNDLENKPNLNGYWDIISPPTYQQLTDLDDAIAGTYELNNVATNKPPGVNFSSILTVNQFGSNSNDVIQWNYPFRGNNEFWFRNKDENGNWETWREVWHSGNLTKLSNLSNDLFLSNFPNDVGYITDTEAANLYEPIFSKNTAFNKNFGTASGTVAQGNDSRILNGQTAFGWGNHANAGYGFSNLALGESSTTAYRGDRGKIAYDYSQIGHVPLSVYTASDILTKIKTVDGLGSGLDAALLDGISSGSFLRSDVSDTYGSSISHLLTINGRLNINTYNGGLRFGFQDGTQTTMYIQGQNGTGDDALAITRIGEDNYTWDFIGTLQQSGYNVWHTGNFTDNSTRWNTAYTHSQLITGNPHDVLATEISDFDIAVSNNPDVLANNAKISANNSTITLQRNGVSIGNFATNQTANETFNFIDENTQLSQVQVNAYELDPNWNSEKSSYLRSDISDTYGSGISQLLTINGRIKLNNYNGGLRFGFNDGTQTTMYIHGQNGPGDDALAITRVAEDNYIWDFRGTLRQGGLNVWHTGNLDLWDGSEDLDVNSITIPSDPCDASWNGQQEAAPKDAVYDRIEDSSKMSSKGFWSGTQTAYDALGSYDSNTIYFIED